MPRGIPSSVGRVRRRLAQHGDVDWARRELVHLATRATDRGEPVLAYTLTNAAGWATADDIDTALAAVEDVFRSTTRRP